MRYRTMAALLTLLLILPAWADVEKHAKKLDNELKKISLTASDADGRRVVNRMMAAQLGVSRTQLVKERKQTGFVYGQIFGAHEVAKQAQKSFDQIAADMKKGRSLLAISETYNLDLKAILSDAKKLNKSINSELDKVANGDDDEQADDSTDGYDPSDDSEPADTSSFSPAERAQANQQVHQRGMALGQQQGAQGMGRSQGRVSGSTTGGTTMPGTAAGHGRPH